MRLFVSADSMRTYRIALLKVTHWPLVALILGYESIRHFFLNREQKGSTHRKPVGSPPASFMLRRANSGILIPSTSVAAGTRRMPFARQARAARNGVVRKPPDVETTDTLEALAAGLRSQLDVVTSLIERQEARKAAP